MTFLTITGKKLLGFLKTVELCMPDYGYVPGRDRGGGQT